MIDDPILATLTKAVNDVLELSRNREGAKPFADAVDSLIASYMPESPKHPDIDKCESPDPITMPLCSARKLAKATADFTFVGAENAASSALYVTVSGWNLAVSTYESSLETALAAMNAAVAAATVTYNTAVALRPDAISRSLYLWYTLQNSVASAVVSYETSAASAGAALATAAGTILAGYPTYAGSVDAAEVARVVADSTANQAFWQGVETGRDT